MPGIVIFWSALGWICIAVLLLFVPLRLKLLACIGAYGGTAELICRHPIFIRRYWFRIDLLQPPCFAVSVQKRNGRTTRLYHAFETMERGKNITFSLKGLLHVHSADFRARIGIPDRPDATALLCVALEQAARNTLAVIGGEEQLRSVRVAAEPDFTRPILRLNLECMITLIPAKVMYRIFFRKKSK